MAVVLRALSRGDFPLLARWLVEPAVHRWWHDDPGALEEQYGASIDGTDPTHVLIASTEGEDVGLVQWYLYADEPGYVAELAASAVDVPPGAGSLDYLLGEERFRGRGLATAMIGAAVAQMVAAGVTSVVVPVHAENVASWRLLERCGFTQVATAQLEPDNPADSRDHVVHRRDLSPGTA